MKTTSNNSGTGKRPSSESIPQNRISKPRTQTSSQGFAHYPRPSASRSYPNDPMYGYNMYEYGQQESPHVSLNYGSHSRMEPQHWNYGGSAYPPPRATQHATSYPNPIPGTVPIYRALEVSPSTFAMSAPRPSHSSGGAFMPFDSSYPMNSSYPPQYGYYPHPDGML